MRLSRIAVLGVTTLTVAVLVSVTVPASAGTKINGFQLNALGQNAIATTGSALDELDGVTVEAVVLPGAARSGASRSKAPASS
jgi:hypothetical protein